MSGSESGHRNRTEHDQQDGRQGHAVGRRRGRGCDADRGGCRKGGGRSRARSRGISGRAGARERNRLPVAGVAGLVDDRRRVRFDEQSLVVLPDDAADLDRIPQLDNREGRRGRGASDTHLAGAVVDRDHGGPRRRHETGHSDLTIEVQPEPGDVDAARSGPG